MQSEQKGMLIEEIVKMLNETTDTELIHLIYILMIKSR